MDQLTGDLYILSQAQNSIVRYAPLFIHSFVLCAPRKILEATQFNQRYRRYEEIENVPDRLRWCRHNRGLTQTEVAQSLGIANNAYRNIEGGNTQHIPKELVERLARFYNIPVADLLDEFGKFLCAGQAQRIRTYRTKLGLGRKAFSRYTGIPINCLRNWEDNKMVISRKCWEQYFKGRA